MSEIEQSEGDHPSRLEYKAHITSEPPSQVVEEYLSTFERFKDVNDARLAALESRGAVDALVEEKLHRIEARLNGLHDEILVSRRPRLEGFSDGDSTAKANAIESYIRKGRTEDLEQLESKGLSVGSEADGGFLVPPEMELALTGKLQSDSPIRSIASTIQVSTSTYKRPFVKSGAGAGWTGETSARPETTSPQLAELSFPAMELYGMPAASKQVLDDAIVNVGQWLVDELHVAFGEQETEAFVSGDGIARPKGFLAYPRQASANPTFGNIGKTSTGTAGAFDADEPADCLYDLVHAVPQRYRRNGTFLMHRLTLGAVRRLKDANGDYLFQPRLSDDLEMRLLGYPLVECDSMPEIAVNSASIAFGDFQRGYLIVDRQGVQIMRDPYSAKPYVLFYATKRVGGGVSDFNALRLLTFSV